jgi:hypothetical protein
MKALYLLRPYGTLVIVVILFISTYIEFPKEPSQRDIILVEF